jgi:hypothetical protein
MDNTPFSKRCEIITNFTDIAMSESWASGFFDFYDLGVAFAIGANGNMLTLHDEGMRYVNDTWDGMCELLGVDNYGSYDDIRHLMEFAGALDEG